jgi:hypothetical protein
VRTVSEVPDAGKMMASTAIAMMLRTKPSGRICRRKFTWLTISCAN